VTATIRDYRPSDERAAYWICLKTGDHGADGEPFYRDDPDALGRIYVGPYLRFEPNLALVLEDAEGVCGYAFGALDSRAFYARYEREWRPALCASFPEPTGDRSTWTRAQAVHYGYHHPEYDDAEPYAAYPSHLHIDLLPRAQGRGCGRAMMERLMERLRERGSPGVHLALSSLNPRAHRFYASLGFTELARRADVDHETIIMGRRLGENAKSG